MKEDIDVSIVIVCMNNYRQLKDCLDSIKQHTSKARYETFVVAYFFSENNLSLLKKEYPWVTVIVSDEIRGFSANNNLALRIAKGKYCFVLNDDTYFTTPVIDQLFESISTHGEASLVSPQILYPNGTIQYSGIPPKTWADFLLILFKLKKERRDKSNTYIRPAGFFKTYNILGAAFMIDTDIFHSLGFLDERYFFGPEDKALSTAMNRKGFGCYVDADIKLYHLGGATGGPKSNTVCATRPAERKGSVIFYGDGKKTRQMFLQICVFLNSALWSLGWLIKMLLGDKYAKYSLIANVNVCRSIFSNQTTTDIFKHFYVRRDKLQIAELQIKVNRGGNSDTEREFRIAA